MLCQWALNIPLPLKFLFKKWMSFGRKWSWYSIWDLDLSNSWLVVVYYCCSLCLYWQGRDCKQCTYSSRPKGEQIRMLDVQSRDHASSLEYPECPGHVKIYIFLRDFFWCSEKGNMHFHNLRVSFRCYIVNQAVINLMG